MGELPYMAVCLAEVWNTHTHTHTHRQTHKHRYLHLDQPYQESLTFSIQRLQRRAQKISTNYPQCLCLFAEFSVRLGMCKTHTHTHTHSHTERLCESECVCESLCNTHTHTHTHTHSLFMNVCECLPKTYRSNKGHFTVCGCLCVYTSKTHTHWTPVIPFQHMLWVWPVSRGALPHDLEPRQPQTIKQSQRWIALKHWSHLKCDPGGIEFTHIAADLSI